MRENESQSLFLGRISSFSGEPDKNGYYPEASIIPTTSPDIVTPPYPILWICQGWLGDLHVDDLVVCGRFANGSGIVICRADGGRTDTFPGDIDIDGELHVKGGVNADNDVTGSGKSLATHTHTDSRGGGTSGPI